MATRKISVTVDADLVDEMRRRVGVRGISRFVSLAVSHELEREELTELLAELEAGLGPMTEEDEAYAARISAALAQVEAAKRAGARRER